MTFQIQGDRPWLSKTQGSRSFTFVPSFQCWFKESLLSANIIPRLIGAFQTLLRVQFERCQAYCSTNKYSENVMSLLSPLLFALDCSCLQVLSASDSVFRVTPLYMLGACCKRQENNFGPEPPECGPGDWNVMNASTETCQNIFAEGVLCFFPVLSSMS